jgi:hypothetical protein
MLINWQVESGTVTTGGGGGGGGGGVGVEGELDPPLLQLIPTDSIINIIIKFFI